MIYILVALKAEAQAFVDKFKLKDYQNENISVIISGIGVENMKKETLNIVPKLNENDTILNVGICGANHKYKIGQLIDGSKDNITCVDYEVYNDNHEIVDMESAGFIEATKNIKNSYVFKIVSDHFEPNRVTKNKAKKLIFDKIDEIFKKVE